MAQYQDRTNRCSNGRLVVAEELSILHLHMLGPSMDFNVGVLDAGSRALVKLMKNRLRHFEAPSVLPPVCLNLWSAKQNKVRRWVKFFSTTSVDSADELNQEKQSLHQTSGISSVGRRIRSSLKSWLTMHFQCIQCRFCEYT